MHNRKRLKYLIVVPMLLLFFKAWAQPHCKVLIFIYPDFCDNSMITLDAHTYGNVTPPITYLWSTGETTSSISVPNASGTYSVTITDAVGCMSTHSVDLLIPQNFSIYIQEFNNCPGQTIILDVEWTQFEKPLNVTYLWSTGETTEYIEVPGPGTYSVTLTDPATGCSQVFTKTVDFLPGPMPVITGDSHLCAGESSTLSVLGGPFDGYLWDPTSETTPSIDITAPGTYTVTVTNSFGCTASDEITVSAAMLIVYGTTWLCTNQPGTLYVFDPSSYSSFLWNTGETTSSITVSTPGTYSVTVIDNYGCQISVGIQVFGSNFSIAGTVTNGSPCTTPNGSIDIEVSPPGTYSYLWSNGATTEDISNLPSNTYTVTVTEITGCTKTASYVVQNSTVGLIIDGTSTDASCGLANGSIDLSVLPNGTYTYAWSNGANTQDINNLSPNTYSVTVTSSTGCTGTYSTTIINTANTISINGSTIENTSCSSPNGGVNVSILPAATYTYAWSNGENSQNLTAVNGGTYTITVTGSNGCSSEETFIVANNIVLPIVSSSIVNAVCGLSNGIIDLTVLPSAAYTFEWSNAATTEDLVNIATGTYTVTVTSAQGCTATHTATVNNSNTSFTVSGIATPVTSCTSFNGGINVTVSPIGNYNFLWSNGATGEDLTNISAGNYSLTVTDANGCLSTSEYVVANNAPTPIVTSNSINPSCGQNNGSIDLTVAPSASYTYLWSNTATSEDLVNIGTGTYMVTVTSAQGCTATHTVSVNNTNTSFNFTGIATPVTSCTNVNGGIDVTVTPSGTYTYLWSNGSTNEDLTNIAASNYILTVTDANGCSSTSEFVVANNTPTAIVTSNFINATCGQNNGSIDITVMPSATYTFLWSNGAATEDLVNIGTGAYIVTVTSAQGCTATHTTNIATINTSFTVSGISLPVTSCSSVNGSINVIVTPSGIYSYLWSNGATTQDLSNIAAGTYDITITDNNNCSTIESYTVIDATSKPIILSNVISASCGKDNGQINLDVTPLGTYNFAWSNGDNTEDLSNLAAGGYTVTVTSSEGCTALQTVVVAKANPPFSISSVIMPVTSCTKANGSITVSPTPLGNYTYLWQNGNTSGSLTDLESGSYTVTVSDAGACSISETYVIEDQTTTPSITSNTINASCGNDNGAVNITVLPIGSYTYNWSNNSTAKDAINLGIGSYTVTVTSVDGCTASHTTIVINTNSNFSINGIVQPVKSCLSPNGSIDISVSPNGTYSYVWSNGSTSPGIANLDIGTYTVTVTDANACKVIASFDITNNNAIPSLLSIITNPTCWDNTGAIDLVVSPAGSYSYLWTNGVTTEDNSALFTGTYTVTVTSTDGCTATHTAIVGNQNFNLTVEAKSTPQSSCASANGSIDISLSLNINCTYLWSNGSTSQDISGLIAGSYTVTVTTQNGCQLIKKTEVAESLVQPNAAVLVHYGACDNLSNWIEVIDTASNKYSIGDGLTFTSEKIFYNLNEGIYELKVESNNGCTASIPFEILHQEMVEVNIDSLVYIKSGQNYLINLKIDQKYFDLIDTIMWSPSNLLVFSDNSMESIMNPTLNTQESMSINVDVILKNQCVLQKRIRIEVVDSFLISIPNVIWPTSGSANNSAFTIYTSVPENSEIEYLRIYDRWGNKVFDRNNFKPNVPELGWDGTFNGNELNPAVFVWVAQIKNGSQLYLKHGDVTLVK